MCRILDGRRPLDRGLQDQTGRSSRLPHDFLTRIVNGRPSRDIDQLLPWAYREQSLKPWPENDNHSDRKTDITTYDFTPPDKKIMTFRYVDNDSFYPSSECNSHSCE